MDCLTKIISSIGSFKVLLECLDFFDVGRNTFLDLLLHRSKIVGEMMSKCSNIKKFFRVINVPPRVEFLSAKKVGFERNWSEFGST